MFGFFKRNKEMDALREEYDRINRITADHSEKVSDFIILINIVNNEDAKKTLSAEQFAAYMKKYNEIAERKEPIESNALQYQHRAFNIVYEIEQDTGVRYEDICGDATDILYMYSNLKPGFDELLEQAISDYTDVVADIISKNPECLENSRMVFRNWVYAVEYYMNAAAMIISAYEMLRTDYYTIGFITAIYKEMGKRVIVNAGAKESDRPIIESWRAKIEGTAKSASDNSDTLDKSLNAFTNSFLYLCGAPNDEEDKERLLKIMGDIQSLGDE